MPVFEPPLVEDVPRVLPETRGVPYLLMRHYSPLVRGRSVVLVDGHYTAVDNPSNDLLTGSEGVNWFLGGHVYVISDALAALLAADGLIVTETTWGDLMATWEDLTGDWQDYPTTWEQAPAALTWAELDDDLWGRF